LVIEKKFMTIHGNMIVNNTLFGCYLFYCRRRVSKKLVLKGSLFKELAIHRSLNKVSIMYVWTA